MFLEIKSFTEQDGRMCLGVGLLFHAGDAAACHLCSVDSGIQVPGFKALLYQSYTA
jgi:hypothetical protein